MLARYPQAVAAEPQSERLERPEEALTVAEQAGIRKWLHRIGEADPSTVDELIRRCQEDAGHRRYILDRAYQEHIATTPEEAHPNWTSVQRATKPAPLHHPAAAVEKCYTETTPRRAENG